MHPSPKALKELIDDYQKLVVREASLSALGDALALVERVAEIKPEARELLVTEVQAGLAPAGLPFPPLSRWRRSRVRNDYRSRVRNQMGQDVYAQIEALMEAPGPRSSVEAPTGRGDAADPRRLQLAVHAVWDLWIPERLSRRLIRKPKPLSSNRYSLLLDAELLLFHQVYFGLVSGKASLPALIRGKLLSAFLGLAEHIPSQAQFFRIWALTCEVLDDDDLADQFYREAIKATPAEEHEFMSVLQSGWSYLIERARFQSALQLLKDQEKRIRDADRQEFYELVRTTSDLEHAHGGR